MGSPEIKPWLIVGGVCSTMRAKQTGTEAVSEGEGNEARGEGWQGVGASNITVEAGEPTRRDPVEGRGRHSYGTFGGKDAGDIEAQKYLNETSKGSGVVQPSA